MKPRRQRPEQALQKTVFEHLDARAAPGVYALHVPNGGYRSYVEAAIFKGLGVRAGFPDVLLFKDGRAWALELKYAGGKLTEAQKQVHLELTQAGVPVGVAYGLDEALQWLEFRGMLRGQAA